MQRGQPDLPVLDPHRGDRAAAALVEAVFNTPSHHRVHHGSNAQYLDRNYGGILIIWDRMFGSFEPEGERVLILKEGLALVGSAPVLAGSAIAVIVWEGHPRGAEDTTQHFAELARERGLSVEEVSTRTGR